MARKKLLTEGEIRQFMKLANLRPISNHKLQEMGMPSMPSGLPGNRDEPDMGMEVGMEDDLGGEDMEAELDVEEVPEAEGEMSLSDEEAQAIIDLADRLRDAMPEAEDEDEEEMDMDIGPEVGDEFGSEVEEEFPGNRDLYEDKKDRGEDKGEKSRTRKGEEDYTTKKGKKKKTSGKGRGEKKGDEAYVNEGDLDEITATGRGYDTGPVRRAKRLPRRGPEEEGPMAPLIDEPSEVLPGTKYDPSEEEEIERKKAQSWRASTAGRREGRDYDEALVAEVARRVAVRLRGKNRKKEMVDQIAERIMQRLTK